MCTGGPVSQHTTGKRRGGPQEGRRLTSSRANTEPPQRHVMVSAPQAPGTFCRSPVCGGKREMRGRDGMGKERKQQERKEGRKEDEMIGENRRGEEEEQKGRE
ncbi:hypothetical protein Q5P01_025542 [Channa striata]|uniref:Uncharacterized protein n=1 Tax=Channa striata TaxID=64152 RepID=A0AA88LLX1_CHASR|nr:hypothetical protein Q5P01_025542 [Channa striata]